MNQTRPRFQHFSQSHFSTSRSSLFARWSIRARSRCRRWITGFSTGQLVPPPVPLAAASRLQTACSDREEVERGEHPTGLDERLGIILVSLRPSVSHLSDLYIALAFADESLSLSLSLDSVASPSIASLQRPFEWTSAAFSPVKSSRVRLFLSTVSESIIPRCSPRVSYERRGSLSKFREYRIGSSKGELQSLVSLRRVKGE